MKFAKDLEKDLVPEWRAKYFNYKQGKKRVKAVAKAVTRASGSPINSSARSGRIQKHSTYGSISPFQTRARAPSTLRITAGPEDGPVDSLRASPAPFAITDSQHQSDSSLDDPRTPAKKTPPMPIANKKDDAELSGSQTQYGSIIATPPPHLRSFELPRPAVSPQSSFGNGFNPEFNKRPPNDRSATVTVPQSAYEAGETISPTHRSTLASPNGRRAPVVRPFVRRIFSLGPTSTPELNRPDDVHMVVHDHVKAKEKEFFKWMDNELEKIEGFYAEKEDEAGARLILLRQQLHEMRDRRNEELEIKENAKSIRKEQEQSALNFRGSRSIVQTNQDETSRLNSQDYLQAWLHPVERVIEDAKAKVKNGTVGPNSKSLQKMGKSPNQQSKSETNLGSGPAGENGRDYIRKPHYEQDVPYRIAKRKLKLALQEFYRGMELLKSYSLLNRTAFRKINKKYDKAVNAHPPLRYMEEKVKNARFVKSDVLDSYMHDVEDLYARYFERGNHKIATGKLRSSRGRPTDQSASAFRNGMLIGVGAVFAIQGVISGVNLLKHEDPMIHTQASYLLQIYGGYFLALYLFSWFCLDCSIWTKNKINYQFVFEFDTRHNLDWRQLAEFPSFLILLLGLFLWVNFSLHGVSVMFVYYPVILIFVTVVLIFIPVPYIFHRSRRWFVYSHWRLILAGLYPVEFRDFFLGDMYCSLTYFMSNIELFFCLYAVAWNNPSQCNSSHSRLLGFFSTLPAIWRAAQCLRRYYDTHQMFPHLVNCGKYAMTIMFGVTLSVYRIEKSHGNLIVFSTFATINSCYCIIWDLFMDWSLVQPHARPKFLRDVRGFKNPNWYYLAMVLDPILRFNWIFYSIYTHDLQHNSVVSFFVAFSEVTRRGMWTCFRVENEHCSNVARFKASRDVPLPYDIETGISEDAPPASDELVVPETQTAISPSPTLSRLRSRVSAVTSGRHTADNSSSRQRQTPTRTFTKILADAHTQDFEKKRQPGVGNSDTAQNSKRDDDAGNYSPVDSSDDEDDEEDDEAVVEAENLGRAGRGSF